MRERVEWWRSLGIAFALTLVIHGAVLTSFTERVLTTVNRTSHVPLFFLYVFAALLFTFAVHLVLHSKLAYHLWVVTSRSLFWHVLKRPPSVFFRNQAFLASDQKHYERAMLRFMKESRVMYAVLALGQTMRHGREQFIAQELCSRGFDHRKDIRLLFLDPESSYWQQRATQAIQHRSDLTIQHLRFDLDYLIEQFRKRQIETAFYAHEPSWRMFVFSDCIFVSRYYEAPHSEMMLLFYEGTELYNWFYSEFLGLCPARWTNAEQAAEYASTCPLDFQEQQLEARSVYLERQKNGMQATQADDWNEAAKRIRQRKKDEFQSNLVPQLRRQEKRKPEF